MRRSQSGFAVVQTILIVIVVGLIGVVGWLVYDRSHVSNSPKQSRQVTNFEECAKLHPVTASYPSICVHEGKTYYQKVTPTEQTKSTGVSSQGYLVIKEWGIKFPVPSSLKSMRYTYDGHGVFLDSDDLSDLAGSKKLCGEDPGYLGVIDRTKDPEEIQAGIQLSKVGEYYYIYEGPQQACLPESAAGEAVSNKSYPSNVLQDKARDELATLLRTSITVVQ